MQPVKPLASDELGSSLVMTRNELSLEERVTLLEQQITLLLQQQRQQQPVVTATNATSSVASLRSQITRLVKHHATSTSTAHYMVWNDVYARLQQLYGFNVRAHRKHTGETWLDVAERHGQLERIYAIVSAELNYSEEE